MNEIEGLVDPPEREGKRPASLDAIDVCRGAKDAALAARAELETSSDGVLDEALASLNVSRAGAALAVAAELGRIGEAVDRALGRLSDAARLCTEAVTRQLQMAQAAAAQPDGAVPIRHSSWAVRLTRTTSVVRFRFVSLGKCTYCNGGGV